MSKLLSYEEMKAERQRLLKAMLNTKSHKLRTDYAKKWKKLGEELDDYEYFQREFLEKKKNG